MFFIFFVCLFWSFGESFVDVGGMGEWMSGCIKNGSELFVCLSVCLPEILGYNGQLKRKYKKHKLKSQRVGKWSENDSLTERVIYLPLPFLVNH